MLMYLHSTISGFGLDSREPWAGDNGSARREYQAEPLDITPVTESQIAGQGTPLAERLLHA